MTSYQNVAESEIPGYNDVPVMDFASTAGGPRPRRARLNHNLSSASLVSNNSGTSLNTLSTPPRGPAQQLSGGSAPPLSKPPSSASISRTSTTSSTVSDTTVDSNEITDDQVKEYIDKLLSLPSSLPEREFEHYGRKLRDSVSKMKQPHRALVLKVVDNSNNKEEVKQTVVRFMMTNDGTSGWAVPLRKLLENV